MITSRSNSLIKLTRSLFDKKGRIESGLYLVEGTKSVLDAYSLGKEIKYLLMTEDANEKLSGINAERTEILSEDVFKSISGEVSPEGAIALIERPKTELRKPKTKCLFLDGVMDPSNVGAIIRTAASFGFTDIYSATCADAYSPKAVRASMGGIFRVNVFEGEKEKLLECINLPIVVADMNGMNLSEFKSIGNFCLVIGNEGHGVSPLLRSSANYTVRIPMENGMESLNAAVSAGILMYSLK